MYNKNPVGWNISIGRDPNSHFGNIFVSNPENLWQIKIDSLFKPNPYGLGMKLGAPNDFPDLLKSNNPSFGFRPLLPTHLQKLQQQVERERPINDVIADILNTKPVSFNQIGNKNFIMGK